jgi:DNA invertase Pin-like site-specific DNA recombinase
MKVKYIRTSTPQQNSGRQQLNEEKFDSSYIDVCSGAIKLSERKEGMKMLANVSSGNISEIHVNAIDRLGRNILDILSVLEIFNKHSVKLYVENIGMYSIIDGKANPIFKMIISVLGNVAEMERTNMLERQKQGIELAKMQGKYKGRLYGSRMSDEEFLKKYSKIVRELNNGESLRRAAALGGVSLGTVQRVKRLIEVA